MQTWQDLANAITSKFPKVTATITETELVLSNNNMVIEIVVHITEKDPAKFPDQLARAIKIFTSPYEQ